MNRSKIIIPFFSLLTAALLALSISVIADPAIDSVIEPVIDSAIDSAIEEIIVTSDFRDSALLKTPASVTVISSAAIAQRQARHLEQVLNLAPNVNFSSGASRGRFIQIRGIGERSQFIEPLNPSVGTLVDGIDFPVLPVPPPLWI